MSYVNNLFIFCPIWTDIWFSHFCITRFCNRHQLGVIAAALLNRLLFIVHSNQLRSWVDDNPATERNKVWKVTHQGTVVFYNSKYWMQQQLSRTTNKCTTLGDFKVLSCVGRTSRCKPVAELKLIKRMDRCNMSQYTVNKSGLWQVYWAHSFRETNPQLLCTQIRDDCRGEQPHTEMQTWTSDIQN